MKLPSLSDYTLRTLIYLALDPTRQATVAELAEKFGVPANHMTKVVHRLGQEGDIATQRGQRGGIRLARPAAQINVGAVIRRTEPDFEMVPCFAEADTCVISPHCVLQHKLEEATAAYLAVLDGCTLADLIVPRSALASLLALRPTVTA